MRKEFNLKHVRQKLLFLSDKGGFMDNGLRKLMVDNKALLLINAMGASVIQLRSLKEIENNTSLVKEVILDLKKHSLEIIALPTPVFSVDDFVKEEAKNEATTAEEALLKIGTEMETYANRMIKLKEVDNKIQNINPGQDRYSTMMDLIEWINLISFY